MVSTDNEITEVSIAAIGMGKRHRKDYGDLRSLARSIDRIGLLQPIVITRGNDLVCGERRLLAFRDVLGRENIPARIVDIDRIVDGEHDENELRKDFTPSERVAIAESIKQALGERRGRPSFKNVHNCAHLSGHKSRDIYAEKAGFGSHEEYRRTKQVVEGGAPELIEAMDAGKASISAAAEVSTLPQSKQRQIIARGENEIIEAAKRIRKQRARRHQNGACQDHGRVG